MLQKINRVLTKMMPVITPTGVILGILFSTYIKDYTLLSPLAFCFNHV